MSTDSSLTEGMRWTTGTVGMGPEILDRMERAVAKVRERLLRATSALNRAGIPYAVVGGNAVAYWVATVDEAPSGTRGTWTSWFDIATFPRS